jgi:ribonuclease P protein subunit POP4
VRTPGNLAQHELIGLPVRVVASSDRKQVGIRGRVVDETRNMLVIEKNDGKVLRIAKAGRTFRFSLKGAACEVEGRRIAFDPVERVRRCAGVKARRAR